jgi:hypothetical protein
MMRLVVQRTSGDCALAALSTLLSATVDYEDVYLAAAGVDRRRKGRLGLRNHDLVAVARELGVTLVPRRRFDLDRDEGVLRVYASHTSPRWGHWVALWHGLVWDVGRRHTPPDGYAVPWELYRDRFDAKFATLLQRV